MRANETIHQQRWDFMPMLKTKPTTNTKPRSQKSEWVTKTTVITVLICSVGVGIWINNTAWRNRKLLWQLQAAVLGGGVGFVVGRFSR
jgi:hypothetical protein